MLWCEICRHEGRSSVRHTHIWIHANKHKLIHSQHRIPFQFCGIAEKIHRCWIKYKQIWICIWIRIHCSATFKTHHISSDLFYSLSISRLSGALLKGKLYFIIEILAVFSFKSNIYLFWTYYNNRTAVERRTEWLLKKELKK